MKSLVITCFIASVILMAGPVGATTYYLKSALITGDNDGSSWANAWQGEYAALDSLQLHFAGGDTALLYGTFRGDLNLPTGAIASNRTLLAGGDGSTNIPSRTGCTWFGGDNMTDSTWTNIAGSIWATPYTPSHIYQHGDTDDRAWCLREDSTTLVIMADYATLAAGSAGAFFHDETDPDSLYVWCTDNANPNTHMIEAAASNCIAANAEGRGHHTTISHINFRSGAFGQIFWGESAHPDSCFIDSCTFSSVGGGSSANTGLIRIMSYDYGTPGHEGHWNYVTHCTFRDVRFTGGNAHGNGVGMYQEEHLHVMYNTFDSIETAINFKTNLGGIDAWYNVAAYNVIRHPDWAGIDIACWAGYDSIYGNIIIDPPDEGGIRITSTNTTFEGYLFIANNTLIDCPKGGILVGIEGTSGDSNVIKYNVTYATSGSHFMVKTADTANWLIDSNMYWTSTPNFNISYVPGTMNFATWQTHHGYLDSTYDKRSSITDPGFDSISATDPWAGFARSGASNEMNVTYGGQAWTVYGAVQPAEAEESGGAGIDGAATLTGSAELE